MSLTSVRGRAGEAMVLTCVASGRKSNIFGLSKASYRQLNRKSVEGIDYKAQVKYTKL